MDAPGYIYYTVQAGDSLWIIGTKHATTVDAIKTINNLSSDQIMPGQILKVPGAVSPAGGIPNSVVYTVKAGDSLFLIGQKFGVSAAKIQNYNGLVGSNINIGQILNVPLPLQKSYIVQSGDTLFLLARRFNTTVDGLSTVNRLTSTNLWIGQQLFVPDNGSQPPSGSGDKPPAPELPVGGQWGMIPAGVVLYHIKAGENLSILAYRYRTTEAAIMTANHLHTDLVMVNQPIFIPENSSQPVVIPYPAASQKEGFGQLMDWEFASWILDTYNTAVLHDLATGKKFKVRRLGGSNHADVEPLTSNDTAVMKDIYGGQWSWERRAVLVYVDGMIIAGSMAGMPHDIKTINDNNFPGHFDLHFLNSRTHYDNTVDPAHQVMVQKAAGN